jgi:hypothetical protein
MSLPHPQHSRRHFLRHYLEMIVAMFAGMAVLGAAGAAIFALADVEFSMTRYPEAASLKMAFDMSVGMALWMRYRGHAWPATLEMCAVMFIPPVALFPLLWAGTIDAHGLMMLEHILMLPLMYLAMLRRRHEYAH